MKSKAYLYDRRGPWPQPSPDDPLGMPPEVINFPEEEVKDFKKYIKSRYIFTLFTYWLPSAYYAWKNPCSTLVDDQEFEEITTHTAFSKFLRKAQEIDRQVSEKTGYPNPFQEILQNSENLADYFIADFSIMQYLQPFEGLYNAPSMVLYKCVEGKKKVLNIYLIEQNLLLSPQNTSAWNLAKLYVLQAASHHLSLSFHSLLHFPNDCINAISKFCFKKNSPILKLLLAHFRFSLILNYRVLRSPRSPVVNNQKFPFAAFSGKEEGLRAMLVADYSGIKLSNGKYNPSYPPFKFTLEPPPIESDYDDFLKAYYEVFFNFTKKVVDYVNIHQKDQFEDIRSWLDYISQYLPDFPASKDVFVSNPNSQETELKTDILAKILAKIMWDLSVAHSADHYDYSNISINKVLFRLRIPPPSTHEISPFDPKKLNKWTDVFRQKMEHKMFFAPANVTLLKDVDYGFEQTELQNFNREFLQELHQAEEKLKKQGIKIYIPLSEIACSIQY